MQRLRSPWRKTQTRALLLVLVMLALAGGPPRLGGVAAITSTSTARPSLTRTRTGRRSRSRPRLARGQVVREKAPRLWCPAHTRDSLPSRCCIPPPPPVCPPWNGPSIDHAPGSLPSPRSTRRPSSTLLAEFPVVRLAGPDVPCADFLRGSASSLPSPAIHRAKLRTAQVARSAARSTSRKVLGARVDSRSTRGSLVRPQKHALPLGEWLVVLAVLLTLTALLIFAVHKVSAAAARKAPAPASRKALPDG